jgi:fatty-acyl-CoA synthase
VQDCLVVGIPDERFGQCVAALVACDKTGPVDAGELAGMVRIALAGYKVPRRIRLVNEIPRLPNGKVDYDAATALLANH